MKQLITAIIQLDFQKHNNTCLKSILVHANEKQTHMLQAKSMKCISLVGLGCLAMINSVMMPIMYFFFPLVFTGYSCLKAPSD
jgi:hypothetical protein